MTRLTFAFVLALALISPAYVSVGAGETIDGRVIQVQLSKHDVSVAYIERKGSFTVELETKDASIEGPRMYLGDGTIAVELIAHPTDGIFLQGERLQQGDKIKAGSTIQVKPGFKKVSELKPGDVYVKLPSVIFQTIKP